MNTNESDSSPTGTFGLLVGIGLVLVAVACVAAGKYSEEKDIEDQCTYVHAFVGNSSGTTVAYKCEPVESKK